MCWRLTDSGAHCFLQDQQQGIAVPEEREVAWLARAEERLHAREEAVEAQLARLQIRQDEILQQERDVAQREATVLAVSAPHRHACRSSSSVGPVL